MTIIDDSFGSDLPATRTELRPTRAEIDVGAIAHNLGVIRRHAGRARVLAVVKADAYGHGATPVVKRLEAEGIYGFGVALAEEGLQLRASGIASEILVLNGVYGSSHWDVVRAGLIPVIYDLREAEAFERAARDEPVGVHLKVDTGMSRLGVPLDQLEKFLQGLSKRTHIRVDGLMTHLATADSDPEYARVQLERFARAQEMVANHGHRPTWVHAANSAATFGLPESRFNMVRPGLALYGYSHDAAIAAELRPAMRLVTRIIALRDLDAGMPVGYDGTFVADGPTCLATIPLGYGDGLPRTASNRGEVLVDGYRCPMVGNVSMDLTTIDVTEVADVSVGDEVVLLGSQGDHRLDATHLADAAGIIAYEVLTNISRRVPRYYPH